MSRDGAPSDASGQPPILELDGLTKHFTLHGLAGRVIVGCRDVSLRLAPGACLALTGVSGAGKSTVVKCVYRTYLPTAGRILYRRDGGGELDLASAPEREVLALRRREIACVSQFLRAVPRVCALDVVAEPLVLLDQPRALARRRAADVLTRLRLPRELWDAHPVNFSGGEKQRVNVARACLMRPRLLLVDEPTAALDPETKRDVVGLLRELKAEGVAILAVLHDRAVVEHLADEVVQMEGGRACPAIS